MESRYNPDWVHKLVRDERKTTTHPDTLGSEQHLVRRTNKMASCRVHSRKEAGSNTRSEALWKDSIMHAVRIKRKGKRTVFLWVRLTNDVSLGGPTSNCMLSQQSMQTAKPRRDSLCYIARVQTKSADWKAWPERANDMLALECQSHQSHLRTWHPTSRFPLACGSHSKCTQKRESIL
jgi:hypothetical protein